MNYDTTYENATDGCFVGIRSLPKAKADGYALPNKTRIKPGDMVYCYDEYYSVAPATPFLVEAVFRSRVLVKVQSMNKNAYIRGWLGYEKPEISDHNNLDYDERHWFFSYVKPAKNKVSLIDNE